VKNNSYLQVSRHNGFFNGDFLKDTYFRAKNSDRIFHSRKNESFKARKVLGFHFFEFRVFIISFAPLNFSPENKRSEFNWGAFVIDQPFISLCSPCFCGDYPSASQPLNFQACKPPSFPAFSGIRDRKTISHPNVKRFSF
jgi:hypothetical protein